MKVLLLAVYRNDLKEPPALAHATSLSHLGRFTQGTAKELLVFAGGQVASGSPAGTQQSVAMQDANNIIHAYGHRAGVAGIMITETDYDSRIAVGLLKKVCDEFTTKYPRSAYENIKTKSSSDPCPLPSLLEYIEKYQNPYEADNIARIQKELDDTKEVLHKTIESVLERGQKIEDLVAKSDNLSYQSKMFYTQAKKQNSCCIVM